MEINMSRCNCEDPEVCKTVIESAITFGDVDIEDALAACLDSMDLLSFCRAIENLDLVDKVNNQINGRLWDDNPDSLEEGCGRKRMESRVRRLEQACRRLRR
jgi:hypothetical protein